MTIKPMLAAKYDPDKQRFPALASVKIDGIRCLIKDGQALSRKLKLIPNKFVQAWVYDNPELEGMDGELMIGDMTSQEAFRRTTSGIMSQDGEPDFTFWAFDMWNKREASFVQRLGILSRRARHIDDRLMLVNQQIVHDNGEVAKYLASCEMEGHEGIMLRDPDSLYKFGRATPNTQELVKVKSFEDAEAVVVGYEEEMHNANEATVSELGKTKRSSHKANLHGKGTLGALVCRTMKVGSKDFIEFSIGSGFSQDERKRYWVDRHQLHGRIVKYRYFAGGIKDRPRFPVFMGFRKD